MLAADVTQFATALAIANGHPDPAAFAQTVLSNFNALQASPAEPASFAPASEGGQQYAWLPVNH